MQFNEAKDKCLCKELMEIKEDGYCDCLVGLYNDRNNQCLSCKECSICTYLNECSDCKENRKLVNKKCVC